MIQLLQTSVEGCHRAGDVTLAQLQTAKRCVSIFNVILCTGLVEQIDSLKIQLRRALLIAARVGQRGQVADDLSLACYIMQRLEKRSGIVESRRGFIPLGSLRSLALGITLLNT